MLDRARLFDSTASMTDDRQVAANYLIAVQTGQNRSSPRSTADRASAMGGGSSTTPVANRTVLDLAASVHHSALKVLRAHDR